MPPTSGNEPTKVRKITVDEAERKLIKERRESLGLTQRQLAAKAGTTNGTISNLENGKHPQIKQSTYMKIRYVLFKEKTIPEGNTDALFKDIAVDLPDLDQQGLEVIRSVIRSLKKPR
jgi:transcriptional regulator with XRE-family HTH domain